MGLLAILTAAVVTMATGDAGPNYSPDVGQTVQTVVIPDGSRWKIKTFYSEVWTGHFMVVSFERGVMSFDSEEVAVTGNYSLTPAAGPVRFDFSLYSGTCWMERNQLVIKLTDTKETLFVLEREKP